MTLNQMGQNLEKPTAEKKTENASGQSGSVNMKDVFEERASKF